MAAVPLSTVLQIDLFTGTPMPWVDASVDGYTAPNRAGTTSIWIENSGATLTVAMKTKRPSNFGDFPDDSFTVPNGTWALPTFAPERFTDISSGLMEFTLSRVTSVRVAAVILQQVFKEE